MYNNNTEKKVVNSFTFQEVIERLGALGRNPKPLSGNEWNALCPAHDDHNPSLFTRETPDGKVLIKCLAGCKYKAIIEKIFPERIPSTGFSLPRGHHPPNHGDSVAQKPKKIVATYPYVDEEGTLLFEVVRYKDKDGNKSFSQRRPDPANPDKWIYNIKGVRRVLYHLPDIIAAKQAGQTIYLVEGEKDADNLKAIGLVATTSPMGSGNWRSEYAETLRGADVVIIPDNDDPGRAYAGNAANSLYGVAAKVRMIPLPGLREKEDVSDWLEAGHTKEELEDLLGKTPEWKPTEPQDAKKEKQIDLLGRIIKDVTFFSDEQQTPYVAVENNGHQEICQIQSPWFKRWLNGKFYAIKGRIPNSEAMTQILGTAEAITYNRGMEHKLSLRVAKTDDAIWYDLGDATWRAIQITPHRWQIVDKPPILFKRCRNMDTQVEPKDGCTPEHLKKVLDFVNLRRENEKILFLVNLIVALIPNIPRPVIDIHGPQGTAKTTATRVLRRLIDPARQDILILPRDMNELAQQLSHNYYPSYDNISGLMGWQSDMLCRAITGCGISKRRLYTDDEDYILTFGGGVAINGIDQLSTKEDLLSRAILFELDSIDPGERKEDRIFWQEFEEARPYIFGAMLDALSKALHLYPTIRLRELPRMADFLRWGYAVAEAIGVGGQAFVDAYRENILGANESAIQYNPTATAVIAFMEDRNDWEGTPTALYQELCSVAEREHIDTRAREWPKSPGSMSRRLKGIAPTLRAAGVECFPGGRTHNEGKKIVLQKSPVTVPKISDTSDTPTQANNHAASGRVDISTATKNSDTISITGNPNNHAGVATCPTCTTFSEPFRDGTNSKMPGIGNLTYNDTTTEISDLSAQDGERRDTTPKISGTTTQTGEDNPMGDIDNNRPEETKNATQTGSDGVKENVDAKDSDNPSQQPNDGIKLWDRGPSKGKPKSPEYLAYRGKEDVASTRVQPPEIDWGTD